MSIVRRCTILFLSSCATLLADEFQPTPKALLDPAAFVQWVDGKTSAFAEESAKGGPASVVWTNDTMPDWPGVKFGADRSTSVRHLRIGFLESLSMGSVLVRGGGVLSVLKADSAAPGDLADNAQWITADRLVNGQVTQQPVGNEDYA